jgi:uncharacterized protein (TIGR03435 family)
MLINRKKIALSLSVNAVLICSATGANLLHAQEASKLIYDVSTVKPHDPTDENMSWGAPKGKFSALNVNLKDLIADAWGVRPDQVSGEPAWASDAHWDVTAKVTDVQKDVLEKLKKEDVKHMDQALLLERFHVKVHLETRTTKVLDLLPAKSGIKLKALPPAKEGDKPDNGSLPRGSLSIGGAEGGGYELIAHGIGINMLIANISLNLQQTVIDKTGLPADAVFDVKLKYAPETGTDTSQNGDAVSIREALEQQLGLHLESTRGPVVTVVVDHVEKPTAD